MNLLLKLLGSTEKTVETIIRPLTKLVDELEAHARKKIDECEKALQKIADIQVEKRNAEAELAEAEKLGAAIKTLLGRA